MAVKEIGEFGSVFPYQRFIGLSSDNKPTVVPIGSTFLETDTLKDFIFDGTSWVLRETTGLYTVPNHTAPTIGATSTAALAANANRLYALLVNDSDTTIYIKLGAAAVVNEGIRLNASGGSYELSEKEGNLYTGAINAICASGGKKILVLEGV